MQPIAATRARVLVTSGRLDESLAWARSSGLTTTDQVSYRQEYGHITLVRVLLAAHGVTGGSTLADATDLLERLISHADIGRAQRLAH